MPDWFYRTASRAMLFRLPGTSGRDLALSVMGTLARLPFGGFVIDLLGHMRPPTSLQRSALGLTFPSPIGLGVGVDAHATALPALARFGFGFLEVSPVTRAPRAAAVVERQDDLQSFRLPDPSPNPGLDEICQTLRTPLSIPVMVRLGHVPGATPLDATEECRQCLERLGPFAALFSFTTMRLAIESGWTSEQWREHVGVLVRSSHGQATSRPLLACVPPDVDPVRVEELLAVALEIGVNGVVIEGTVRHPEHGLLTGPPAREPALLMTARLRARWPDLIIIASGGVHEPDQALSLFGAGAQLVQIDSGLVFAGPGLPKRVNEALLFLNAQQTISAPEPLRAAETSWLWLALLGAGMLIGAVMALWIASTAVVLPYDEEFVRMSRAELDAVNPRLLAFLTHDRVTLAGAMIATGVLYLGLTLFGMRRGQHWTKMAVLPSAAVGFLSFFLFLGFRYFDPFHAFVTVILFQLMLMGWHCRMPPRVETSPPNLREDWQWRWSLWGQFLLVIHGAVLIVAGLTIATVGCTFVFVHEDLEFMNTTREALEAANWRLMPLVAHDRASFGGNLVSCGVVILFAALWGYRQGAVWLWWTFLIAGGSAYAAAIGVHLAVGYNNLMHLAPAFVGAAVMLTALALSYPYLHGADAGHQEAWQRRLDTARRG